MTSSLRKWRCAGVPGGVRECGGAGRNTDGPRQVDGPPGASQGPCTGSFGRGTKRPGEDEVGRCEGLPDSGFRHSSRPPENAANWATGGGIAQRDTKNVLSRNG
ncbi:unnamed protein product [Echinostoma caproni]|uniref:Uncharacterized protein n=1 Tax=Echinostoma caproni TaxID=27848 RepID=A0A183ACR8_9TREM|nr:unnamed protein product [Echinostoma caproni]